MATKKVKPTEEKEPVEKMEDEAVEVVEVIKENKKKVKVGTKNGVYAHQFREPYKYEDKEYITLNFYFNRLTGRDMINIETEMQANNEYALDPILSRNFQSKMAAKAAGVGFDMIESLPLSEFNKITNEARNFLLNLSAD